MFGIQLLFVGTFIVLAFFGGWQVHTWADAQAQLKQVKHVVTVTQKQGVVNQQIAVKNTQTEAQIEYRTKTLIKEVPIYVTQKADADCIVPVGFVRLLNSSARGVPEVPDPTPGAYDAPSGVALDTVATVEVSNNAKYQTVTERLSDLQQWVIRQQQVSK